MKNKKKFKDTKIGKFLTEKAPSLAGDLIGLVGDITGVGILSNIGEKIKSNPELSDFDKSTALELLNFDIQEMNQVTERLKLDMVSDSWLSKNIRPLVLLWLILTVTIICILDSSSVLTVKNTWITLFSTLLVTTITFYFGSRGIEKYKKISNGK